MSFVAVAVGAVAVGGAVYKGVSSKNAADKAAGIQTNSLKKIQQYTEEQMDPELINKKAVEADIERAKNQLALQKEIDPALAAQRTAAQNAISAQLAGVGSAESDRIAALAAKEGSAGVPGMDAAKKELIDAALTNLRLGGTLPPDVQAELMQAGLQQSGQVTGAAGGAAGGVGSSILNQVLGTEGLKLRAQRETQAANLATAAGNLEAQRQEILQALFPRLQQQQMANLGAASGVLQQSNAMVPQAGLSGADVANIWLARVGAINQLASGKANVAANQVLAKQQANAGMAGGIAGAAGGMIPVLGSLGMANSKSKLPEGTYSLNNPYTTGGEVYTAPTSFL